MKFNKIKIDPFLTFALRENLPYLIMFAFLIVSAFIVPSYMIGRYFENNSKIRELGEEIEQNRVKQSILAVSGNENIQFLDEDVRILKSLIPDSENYFSIIYALDQLSIKTGFVITAYTINLQESTPGKISLTVTGFGDQNSFLNFLKGYNFEGGRLITAERIEFNKDKTGSSTLTLNFYNKKVGSTEDQQVDYEKILSRLAELRAKVSVVLQTDDREVSTDYPTENNPF